VTRSLAASWERYLREPAAGLAQQWQHWDSLMGRPVRISDDSRELFRGVACGITDQGELRVDDRTFSYGDVSVRSES
jgi:biotin-(acetyl-CoA carboxylase) ligase